VGRLVLVPTPIGNLSDITLRALEQLREASAIAAEDTRHTRVLLTHHGIDAPLVRLDEHTIESRGPAILDQYENLAFVTDAGTPGISDPGVRLVALALERGDEIEALPGPTAFVPALVLSGLPLARFTFEGFLPRQGRFRRDRLEEIARSTATSVLYESPRRVAKTLADLREVCGGDRQASVSRELSKRFETTYRGSLDELLGRLTQDDYRGEFVIVVGPAGEGEDDDSAVHRERAQALAGAGVTGKQLRQALEALGAPRNVAYQLALGQANE